MTEFVIENTTPVSISTDLYNVLSEIILFRHVEMKMLFERVQYKCLSSLRETQHQVCIGKEAPVTNPRLSTRRFSFIAKRICETIGNFRSSLTVTSAVITRHCAFVLSRAAALFAFLAMTRARERGMETFARPLSRRFDNIEANEAWRILTDGLI